jgi:hypothetical protein
MGGRPILTCEYEIFHATIHQPAEYCAEDVEVGKLYCWIHDPDNGEPDWDDVRKDMLVGRYDCD